jgi:hypothetical protein
MAPPWSQEKVSLVFLWFGCKHIFGVSHSGSALMVYTRFRSLSPNRRYCALWNSRFSESRADHFPIVFFLATLGEMFT